MGVRWQGVSITHNECQRAVVSNLTLEIPFKQKIGLCGRSGSGKSSICMSLPRVTRIQSGKLTINGIEVEDMPLRNLRRYVWTVPQDVTLFSGTLRSNLDPEKRFQDSEIWVVLEKLGLANSIRNLDTGLDTEVIENGDNFSHGLKQELNLARAFLLRPPVLILDEATSALDPRREDAVHRALLETFAESTVISVAHRITNLIGYDRVLVIGDGRILEDGRPTELLKKPMGFFSALWRAAGEKPV